MTSEKDILEKLVRFTDKDTKETRLIIKNLGMEIVLDGNLKRNDKLRIMIVGLNSNIEHNNECLDYLNKRLDIIKPAENLIPKTYDYQESN